MRILCLILGLILLPVGLHAAAVTSVIKREVGKCAVAWQRSDYAAILSYLPPGVIQQRGGRAALLRELKDQFAQARSLGVEQLEAIPGQPPAPKQIGRWLTSMISLTAVLHSAHLNLTQQTYVLGLSSDQGKRWFFVLLYQITQADLNAWFPEFAGKIIVPSDPLPQMEVVY
jgi:hypothetical protein